MIALLTLCLITAVGAAASAKKLRVAVTLSDILPIVTTVGGGTVTADWIMPPGSDPHSFSLTANLHRRLQKADLIVYARSDFLSFEADVKQAFGGTPALDWSNYAAHGARLKNFPKWENSPHGFWLDHENAAAIAKAVAEKLLELGGDVKTVSANLGTLLAELKALQSTETALEAHNNAQNRTYVATVPGVAYSIANADMDVGEVLLREGAGFVSGGALKRVTEKLRSEQYSGIVCPISMKQAKPGEISRQLSRDTGAPVLYVQFLTGVGDTSSYLGSAYYNAAVLSQPNHATTTSTGGTSAIYAALAVGVPCIILIIILAVRLARVQKANAEAEDTGGIFED